MPYDHITIVEVRTDSIKPGLIPSRDLAVENYVYEHLRYFLAKVPILPAIGIKINNGVITATDCLIYFRIARDLSRPNIRAVLDKQSDPKSVAAFVESGIVRLLDKQIIVDEEESDESDPFVFFFDDELSPRQVSDFRNLVEEHFVENFPLPKQKPEVLNFSYNAELRVVEFDARSARYHYAWMNALLANLIEFHRKQVPIASFQGRRFMF